MNRITKSLISTAAASFLVAGPIAGTSASADQLGLELRTQSSEQRQYEDRDWDRCRDDRGQWTDRDDRCDDRRDRRDGRKEWRDTRDDSRWDDRWHNGYYANNDWHFGPPPQNAYNRRGFALGYHPWQAGQHLGYYNGRFIEVNYRTQNLKRPRRGDHWVRDDQGVFILASISSGLIRQVLNRNARY
jgi:Ni/Co efflux regulator RcnB